MTAAQPLSKAIEINEQMKSRILELGHYLNPEDDEIISLDEVIRQIESTQDEEGAFARANWAMLQGDVYVIEESVAKARRIGAHQQAIWRTQVAAYANLSFGSKCLSAFQKIHKPNDLISPTDFKFGIPIGAFARIEELAKQAEMQKLDLSVIQGLPTWRLAAAALAHQHVTDEHCASVADMAGEVIRPRRLFWLDLAPSVHCHGFDGPVLVNYRVDVSPEEAAAMSLELVDKMIDRDLADSPFLISFTGIK